MPLTWKELTCTPDKEAIDALAASWSWCIGDTFTPLLFTALGDMFYETDEGSVFWLNTGTGEVERVADNVEAFNQLLREEIADEWLLPPLVEALIEAGKVCADGECYTYVTLPVFAEGEYTVENFNPVPAREHFEITGSVLHELQDVPDGTNVNIDITH
ncbi:MAG: T6SS immunity protein Tdi1 domain-containing protein [Luteibacter sp.]